MSKTMMSVVAAALVCVAATSASAANGISADTLSDMGLAGLQVMSDSDALAVRGMGYSGSMDGYKHRKGKMKKNRATTPHSTVFGNSSATVNDKNGQGGSHSENGYQAWGPYEAWGENFSEATIATTETETVTLDGSVKSVTTVWQLHVEAGGFSSARSF